jgi:hypothetical protein
MTTIGWAQARREMLMGRSVRSINWDQAQSIALANVGQARSNYVLSMAGCIIDEDWCPELSQLKDRWTVVPVDNSHYWEAPF